MLYRYRYYQVLEKTDLGTTRNASRPHARLEGFARSPRAVLVNGYVIKSCGHRKPRFLRHVRGVTSVLGLHYVVLRNLSVAASCTAALVCGVGFATFCGFSCIERFPAIIYREQG